MNAIGGGKPTETLPLLVFSDETSGNTTKKWNRLETFSMSFAGLLRKEMRKTEHIHFLGTSNIVPSVPLGKSIANDLKGIYNSGYEGQRFVLTTLMTLICTLTL